MICFEVTINGKLSCTAGVDERGVLSAILTWVKNASTDPSGKIISRESLDIRVGGLTHPDTDTSQHVEWINEQLSVGDEIIIRVIEATSCDDPTKEGPRFDGCAFCGKRKSDRVMLVAGSDAFICDKCIEKYAEGTSEAISEGRRADTDEGERCSFCGRRSSEASRMILGSRGNICNRCLGYANMAFEKSLRSDPGQEDA